MANHKLTILKTGISAVDSTMLNELENLDELVCSSRVSYGPVGRASTTIS